MEIKKLSSKPYITALKIFIIIEILIGVLYFVKLSPKESLLDFPHTYHTRSLEKMITYCTRWGDAWCIDALLCKPQQTLSIQEVISIADNSSSSLHKLIKADEDSLFPSRESIKMHKAVVHIYFISNHHIENNPFPDEDCVWSVKLVESNPDIIHQLNKTYYDLRISDKTKETYLVTP